jgi:hypothetical protein
MSDPIKRLRELLSASDAACAANLAHFKDKRHTKPPYDEWWGPEAVQDAASYALDLAPRLLAVVEAADCYCIGQGEGALMQLVAALDELRATPSPEEQGK